MKVSACIIARNEVENIGACLASLKNFVDEIIVVDTGSEDQTILIAKQYQAKVYSYCWNDDFAAAKNYAIDQATGDWIVFLDADEYFTDATRNKIKDVIQEHANLCDAYSIRMVNIDRANDDREMDSFNKTKMFRKDPDLRFQGSIHEQLVKLSGGKFPTYVVKPEELLIYHTGYSSDRFQSKCERNLKLLLKALDGTEDEKIWYGYLADVYYGLKEYQKAVLYAEKAIKSTPDELFDSSRRYRVLINSLRNMGAPEAELLRAIESAILKFPDLPDFNFEKSVYYYETGQYDEALSLLIKTFELHAAYQGVETMSFDADAVLAQNIMAAIYEAKEMYVEAVICYQKVLLRDKYNQTSFRSLYLILSHEDEREIIAFLNQIYDKGVIEDLTFLIEQIGFVHKGKALFYYINAKKKLMQDETIDIEQLFALQKYQKIATSVKNDLLERLAIQAATLILQNSESAMEERMKNLPVSYQTILQKYYNAREQAVPDEQFSEYIGILNVLLTTNERKMISHYARCAFDFSVAHRLQVANSLFDHFFYEEAVLLYKLCITHLKEQELELLYKHMGECLFRMDMCSEARKYLLCADQKDAHVKNLLKWSNEKISRIER